MGWCARNIEKSTMAPEGRSMVTHCGPSAENLVSVGILTTRKSNVCLIARRRLAPGNKTRGAYNLGLKRKGGFSKDGSNIVDGFSITAFSKSAKLAAYA